MADSIYNQLSRYTQPPLIILGTMGAIFNQILFTSRKSLRTTSCSFYFRALSLNDFLVLYIYVLLQWLTDQYGVDPTKEYDWYCKMKTYLQTILYTLSPYFVVLACFDRLCTSSTHVRLRRIATVRIASFLIPAMTIFIFAIFSHMPFFYMLTSYPSGSYCTPVSSEYNRVFAILVVIALGIVPPILMMILCITTLILLRRQRRRIMPINQARLRQRDNQLLKMLLLYVVFHVITTIPFSTTLLIAVYQISSTSPTILLLYRLSVLLFNTNYSTSFYIYTLSTPFYRQELYCLIKDTLKKFNRIIRPNYYQPKLHITVNTRLKRS
ncbi:unnamed protein product [Adineta steineri]|uniref:G-protein coupled receptors family 1 profile domain-containing protein n=1 Tax=Adineta steineri TaxID=433720 RepID=A0A813VFI6_9BILA|nr:unnamed protein product [Adineta steineri]